jgi:protein TonB
MSAAASVQPDGGFSLFVLEGQRQLTATVPGFSIQSFTYGSVDLLRNPVKIASSDTSEFQLSITQTPTIGGISGGVVGGVLGGILAPPPPPPPSAPIPATSPTAQVYRTTGAGEPVLVSSIPPAYPPLARAAQVQGNVILQIQIAADGTVGNVVVVSGHALLNDAAIQAVQQWRFMPGQAVPATINVTVNFSMR